MVVVALCLAAPAAAAEPETETPHVAVLPFQAPGALSLQEIGSSLAEDVRARLAASGRARLVDPAPLIDSVGADAIRGASETQLRNYARDLGAGFVVTGTLTQLAGSFSLDVRVTPAASAQLGRTVVVTAASEEELFERVDEVAERVLSEVVGAAPSRVAMVEITGSDEVAAAWIARLKTRTGNPYDPVTVRDDLAALRGDPAVGNASVATERAPGGVVVRFAVATTTPKLAPAPEGATAARVDDVRIRGNQRIESDAILSRIGTKPGGPYRASQVAKDVRAVYALGFFRNVEVFTEPGPEGGRIVIFEVEETAVVRQISISGNDHIDSDKIRDILTLTVGSALDYPLLFENRGRIQALYKAEGYYLAEVEHEIETLSPAAVGIHFVVIEGEKLKLRNIEFTGNEAFSDRELRDGFKTKKWHFWSYATSWFDKSGTYSEPLFLQDLSSVSRKYADAGYVQAEIGEPVVTATPNGLTVSVRIVEGDQFRVGTLDVVGDDTVDIDGLRELLKLEEGDIFNRSYLTQDVSSLTEHYTNRGFYFASVSPLSNLSEATQTVDVIFQVQKGPLYFIRNVNIDGNTVTIDPVVRREVPIVEGELYSQREILIAKARVQSLGFFEEVDIQAKPTEAPDQIDLDVKLVERPTGSFSFGAGYSSQDSFVVTGSLSQDNLFGRGYAVRLSADIGGSTQRFFLSFSDPYFLGSNFSLGTTVFNTSVNFEDFEQQQTGADFVLGHALTEDNRARGFLRYSWASREITEDNNVNAASVILRELIQNKLTTSLMGLSLSANTLNDRLSPTSGYALSGSLEFAGIGFFSNFLRAEARAAWYKEAPWWLLDDSAFAVSARVGYTLPLNSISDFDFPEDSDGNWFTSVDPIDGNLLPLQDIDDDITLPLSERYFLGGLGEFQLRGFKARSVGPRRAIIRPATPFNIPEALGSFIPVGRRAAWLDPLNGNEVSPGFPGAVPGTVCDDNSAVLGGNGNGKCNDLGDKDIKDFEDLDETDVIGGNKFVTTSFEYRFPISETIGLQGLVFFDMGNAFAEGDNLFDVTEWRYGTGLGVQWFSPFGPLAVILGFPLDPLEDEKSPVFEFSVGGQGF